MPKYGVFFNNAGTTYTLPANPEEIQISSSQSIEKYEVLKLGQVAVPTYMELAEYSFECEFPHDAAHYTGTNNKFENPDFYLGLFKTWRDGLIPVKFIVRNSIGEDISSDVLIESLTITEKAGEEGDKYVAFKLLEYRPYGKKIPRSTSNGAVTSTAASSTNPKNNGTYVVKTGDSLWSIAKKYYGDGSKYTKIYNANKNIIKNPSLIYPGQKLVIPS